VQSSALLISFLGSLRLVLLMPCSQAADHRIPESQHGRGWQGPLWVPQPSPLPKQGHPEQAAQDRGQAGLEYLQRRRLHSLPGQPVPGLRHLQIFVGISKVPFQPSLLQAEQAQLPQPFLAGEMIQSPHQGGELIHKWVRHVVIYA